MSFASGFASGFSSGFSDSVNYNRQKERDAFGLLVDKFSRNQEALKISKQEDKKLVDQAKTIAAQAGLETDAIPSVYQLLKTGIYTPQQLMDQALKGNLGFKAKVDEAEMMGGLDQSVAKPADPASAPMDLLAQPAQPREPAGQQPQDGNIFERFKSVVMGNRDNGQKYIDRAINRIAETYGISPEEARQIVQSQGGYTNEEMSVGDPSSVTLGVTRGGLSDEEKFKLYSDLDPKIKTQLIALKEQKQMFESLNEDVKSVIELGSKDPQALTFAADIAQNITKTYNAGKSIFSLFTYEGAEEKEGLYERAIQARKEGKPELADSLLRQAESELEKDIAAVEQNAVYGNMRNVAETRTILEMKYSLMAYKLGIMYNQSGRDFAEKERQFMEAIFKDTTEPEKMVAKMEELMSSEFNRITRAEQELRSDFQLQTFENMLGGDIGNFYGTSPTFDPEEYYKILENNGYRAGQSSSSTSPVPSEIGGETIMDVEDWLNQ